MSLKIGILGGIGPQASAYFYQEIINNLKKSNKIKSNNDYPQLIINSINAPELVTLKSNDELLLPYLNGIKELAKSEPDFIVMVCNTIHLFRDYLIDKSGFQNILSIRDIVYNKLRLANSPACVLGTPLTINSGLYNFEKIEYSILDTEDQNIISQVVLDYNSTGEIINNKKRLLSILEKQNQTGPKTFLLACTEISELLKDNLENEILDTLELLLSEVEEKIFAAI